MQRLAFPEQTLDWYIFFFNDLVLVSGRYSACTNDFNFVLSFSVLLKTPVLTIFEIVKTMHEIWKTGVTKMRKYYTTEHVNVMFDQLNELKTNY